MNAVSPPNDYCTRCKRSGFELFFVEYKTGYEGAVRANSVCRDCRGQLLGVIQEALVTTRPTPTPTSEYVKQTDVPEISEKDILWWLKHLEEKPEEEKRAFMRIAPTVLRMALASLRPTPGNSEAVREAIEKEIGK